MELGNIISLPLSNGFYACGVVLQFDYSTGKRNRTSFIIGLLDWTSQNIPTSETISSSSVIEHGQVHVKTIGETNSEIIGLLSKDLFEIPLSLDQAPSKDCHLRQGFEILRLASTEEQSKYSVFKTLGYNVFRILAEKHFVKNAGV